jgi:two-component SAPR family response regulator
VIIILLGAVFTFLGKRIIRKKNVPTIREKISKDGKAGQSLTSENGKFNVKHEITPNSILFFGGFQVIDRDGEDITRKFTPLLKELFLLIFLNSIKDKGISVFSLTEILWFSMDAKTAKNNRAVNIAKLKNLLSEIDGCTLSRKTSYWQMIIDDSILYNDYWSCVKIIKNKNSLATEDVLQFFSMIRKGPLLGNSCYEWLDEFKQACSNMIIDGLKQYIDRIEDPMDPDFMIELADTILIFDMMHEEAIAIKCKALAKLGKHSLAKEIFAKFSKDYTTLYDEPYNHSFTDILKV